MPIATICARCTPYVMKKYAHLTIAALHNLCRLTFKVVQAKWQRKTVNVSSYSAKVTGREDALFLKPSRDWWPSLWSGKGYLGLLWVGRLKCEHTERETFLEHFPHQQSPIQLLQSSEYNWFEFIDSGEFGGGYWCQWEATGGIAVYMENMENDVLTLSYEAYIHSWTVCRGPYCPICIWRDSTESDSPHFNVTP